MYRVEFYVPEKDVEKVKKAMFDQGAGKMGNYDSCCWQTKGTGQFRPLDGSRPHIGQHHEVEKLTEYKVEMVCRKEAIKDVVRAMIYAHPYETPAYTVMVIEDPFSSINSG